MHSSVLTNNARKGVHMIADRVQRMHLLPDSRALHLHGGHGNRDLPLIQLLPGCACLHRLLKPRSVSGSKRPSECRGRLNVFPVAWGIYGVSPRKIFWCVVF